MNTKTYISLLLFISIVGTINPKPESPVVKAELERPYQIKDEKEATMYKTEIEDLQKLLKKNPDNQYFQDMLTIYQMRLKNYESQK